MKNELLDLKRSIRNKISSFKEELMSIIKPYSENDVILKIEESDDAISWNINILSFLLNDGFVNNYGYDLELIINKHDDYFSLEISITKLAGEFMIHPFVIKGLNFVEDDYENQLEDVCLFFKLLIKEFILDKNNGHLETFFN